MKEEGSCEGKDEAVQRRMANVNGSCGRCEGKG